MAEPTDQPDLRALAAEAATDRLITAWPLNIGCDLVFAEQVGHEAADAALAAVLPAHRALVLEEAAQMILTHIDEHFPADGNDAQRRARRILRIAVQVVSPTPTREQIADALVGMGILKRLEASAAAESAMRRRAATGPGSPLSEPQTAQNAPAVGREAPEAHGGAEPNFGPCPHTEALGRVGHSAPKCPAEAERDRLAAALQRIRETLLAIADVFGYGLTGEEIAEQDAEDWDGLRVRLEQDYAELHADRERADRYEPVIEAAKAWRAMRLGTPTQPKPESFALIAAVDALGDAAKPAACCDMHGRNCEPPSELCCPDCTEAAHDTFPIRHADGSTCSAPDLSGNGDGEQKTAQLPAGEDIRTEETT